MVDLAYIAFKSPALQNDSSAVICCIRSDNRFEEACMAVCDKQASSFTGGSTFIIVTAICGDNAMYQNNSSVAASDKDSTSNAIALAEVAMNFSPFEKDIPGGNVNSRPVLTRG